MTKTRLRFISTLAAFLFVITTYSGCTLDKDKSDNTESSYYVEAVSEVPRVQLHYETDTIDLEDEINKLGIREDKVLPKSVYKAISYIDSDHIERIGVVKIYLRYIVEEGEVVGYYYDVCNVFNDYFLFSCDSFDDVHNEKVIKLNKIGKLEELGDIVAEKGMDTGYVQSVVARISNKDSLSLREVAEFYVSLVNSFNRIQNKPDMQLKISMN